MVAEGVDLEQDRQNREVLAAMMGESEKAPEPGTMKIKDIIHRGDDDLPTPMVTKVMTSAGYRWIYDTETGDRSLTNLNMLPMQLRKMREDGTPMYSIHKPTAVAVKRAAFKCLLHKDDPTGSTTTSWASRSASRPTCRVPSWSSNTWPTGIGLSGRPSSRSGPRSARTNGGRWSRRSSAKRRMRPAGRDDLARRTDMALPRYLYLQMVGDTLVKTGIGVLHTITISQADALQRPVASSSMTV